MGGGASSNSGKYVGQLLRGSVRHGRGSCALSDGSYYEGDWYDCDVQRGPVFDMK
jgi:hypothetical protein